MAKGMNKRKEVKDPETAATYTTAPVPSPHAEVAISPGKPKD